MVFKWKYNKFPVDAQTAGEYLRKLERENGGLHPAAIVEKSRRKDALLHDCFEWDDAKAAEGFREVQAREIIRFLVVVEVADGEKTENRAFVSVSRDEEETSYVSIQCAMNNNNYRNQVLERAMKELVAFKKKYSNLKELSDIFEAIEAAEEYTKVA